LFQLQGWLSIKDYESAHIKAQALVASLEMAIELKYLALVQVLEND
jgi:hypothetical protein